MNGPTLRIHRVGIDAWRESVASLHRNCPVVRRAPSFPAPTKVTVDSGCAVGTSGELPRKFVGGEDLS